MALSGQVAKLESGRVSKEQLDTNFSDLHPEFDAHEAAVAADRCYFCYDAPCVTACPTSIDIPLFIRQIATDMPLASAKTIFDQNILGGMCARVCPTETLCEEACVREVAEGKPVEIGRLQRYATDVSMRSGQHPYARADITGKKIAIVGAGPAGLAAAHRLAMLGNDVDIFDAGVKPGGLNEFGIAAYKATDNFAQDEIEWLLQIGGIKLHNGKALGKDFTLNDLSKSHDATFIGIGLDSFRNLSLDNENLSNVENAVDFIARLRQSSDFSEVPVGSNVVVIGGGMTAIDAAVQSKLLGAEEVTLVYRGSQTKMPASQYEQEIAKSKGVRIIFNAKPVNIEGSAAVENIEFEQAVKGSSDNKNFVLKTDHVLKAIGQLLTDDSQNLEIEGSKIKVNALFETSVNNVWAGGDCVSAGDDLTVTAVAQGRDAAENIHSKLMGEA